MELALAGDGFRRAGGEEQHVRIKLQFEDSSILNAEQVQDGLTRSWFLVRGLPRTIADLTANIVLAFRLLQSCPNGISLQMEDFTFPPSEPVDILKDKDIVSIRKRTLAIDGGRQQTSWSSDTLDRSAPLGVKHSALQEFERETGGYESEQEDMRQNFHGNLGDISLGTASNKKEKKRKRASLRIDEQGNLKQEVVPYMGDHTGGKEKERKSKKQKLTVHEDEREEGRKSKKTMRVRVQKALDKKECQKDKKEQQIECFDQKRKKKVKANRSGSNSLPDVEKQHCSKSSHKVISVSSSSGEKMQDEEKQHTESQSAKKPSRSSLRKKAKRRWRREHAAELATKASEKLANGPMEKVAKDALTCPSKPEDDGDAEEERLPYIVKPGHIRFQLSDEDDVNVESNQPLTSIDWSGISKRKGQSWGQEKSRKGNKKGEEIEDMEICDLEPIDYETFPSLDRAPQKGDIIAYRILELTPSLSPELSEYRVGKVCDIESQSGTLKVAEVPDYPLSRRPEDNDAREDELPCLHDTKGFLELQISSFAHVRLISSDVHETCKMEAQAEPVTHTNAQQSNTSTAELGESNGVHEPFPTQASIEAFTLTTGQSNTSTAKAGDNSGAGETCKMMQAPAEPINTPAIAQLNISREALESESIISELLRTNGMQSTATNSGAWMELSQELERKKEELTNRSTTSTDVVQQDHNTMGNGQCNGQKKVDAFQPKGGGPRGWHRRAGGLGSTIALLRSQFSQNSS